MADQSRRFACTLCGKCCNRAPEVELSEAAGLVDHFVFRLMFRVYDQPDFPPTGSANETAVFFERKRQLKAFSARFWPIKSQERRKARTRYLVLSALALDGGTGACPALDENRCSIWSDRPLTCRSVPLHYSTPDSALVSRFDAFVTTPGFACDTSDGAPVLIADGAVADAAISSARREAIEQTTIEARWKQAIVAQMRPDQPFSDSLPTRSQVEQHAASHAITVPMAAAWQIAASVGLVDKGAVRDLVGRQLRCIDRELATQRWARSERETLVEMRADYAGGVGP
ncbi:MAG: YkgJ family cysteine cluster protein [Sphingomicrobium sp.]